MFAGLSFLTRMLKYFFEKIGIGNVSEGDVTSESFDKELVDHPSENPAVSQV